jgi:SAM-dependent methyltransferase
MAISPLRAILAHPLSKGLDLDDPETTDVRLRIIQEKPFLRRIYNDWYALIRSRIPEGNGSIVELGSGAGYFEQFVPDAIQTEVFWCRNAQLVADGQLLPFATGSLKAIAMTDVFHHIPNSETFLKEAVRCLRPGGQILMVEPWVSGWSKLIYRQLHHEPFLPEAIDWKIPGSGPLSAANGALPWIVFVRDRQRLFAQFPELRIEETIPMMPFRYLVSGGVSMRTLMPEIAYGPWKVIETILSPWAAELGMFAFFRITRT